MNNRKKHKKIWGIGATSRLSTSREDAILLASAKMASSKAVRSSMALGITIKAIKNHELIAISPDKSIKVLRRIAKPNVDISSLRKGMILDRK